jgi:hypothetical protein
MLLKMSDGIVEELAPSQTKDETTDSLCASAVEAPATLKSSVCTNWKWKHWGQHIVGVPFVKTVTDITGTSPQIRKNGDMSVGHLRQADLRSEHCDVMT